MRWVGEKFRRRLKVAGFLVLLLGGAAFLVVIRTMMKARACGSGGPRVDPSALMRTGEFS